MGEFVEAEDVPVALAAELREAGLRWRPAPGDRFVVTTGTLDGEVFTVSDMVVEVIGQGSGDPVLGFNGTTEWALDSVSMEATLWLPREGQLRRLLGRAFRRLDVAGEGYRVHIATPGGAPAALAEPGEGQTESVDQVEETFDGTTAAEAYGRALAVVIGRALG